MTTRQVNEAPARFAAALAVLGADTCIAESAFMSGDTAARSHVFVDRLHRLCTPRREVTEPFVLTGSQRPTCATCRRKYDEAVAVVNVAAEDYDAIRGECIGEPDSITLDDVDPVVVAYARAWAESQHKAWPPPPVNDLGSVTIVAVR